MRAVVVGAGASARELIRRLGDSWSVTVIDPDPDRLRLVEKIRDVETVEGDGWWHGVSQQKSSGSAGDDGLHPGGAAAKPRG